MKSSKEPFRVICIKVPAGNRVSYFVRKYTFSILKIYWVQKMAIKRNYGFKYVIGRTVENHMCVSGIPITENEFKENFRVIK